MMISTGRPLLALILLLTTPLFADQSQVTIREVKRLVLKYEQLELECLAPLAAQTQRSSRSRLLTRVKSWKKSRDQAVEAAFDETSYPNPGPKRVIRGPFTGYRKVSYRFKKCEKAFRPLLQTVQKMNESLGSPKTIVNRIKELDSLALQIEAGRRSLETQKKRLPTFERADLSPLRLLLLLETQAEVACQKAISFEEPERSLFFVAYGLRIERENTKIQTGMDPDAFLAVRELGRFRMALGFLPFQVEATLTRSIEGHLIEMRERRYFGHFSPNPKRRSVVQRTALAGWEGTCGENLSSSIPEDAIRAWRWDGGHCRIMISPRWTHVGMGWKGGSGMNVGSGPSTRVPRVPFFPHP